MKFNIGDIVKDKAKNSYYWIIIDMDNTNYSMKPVHNMEYVNVKFSIIIVDRFCECC